MLTQERTKSPEVAPELPATVKDSATDKLPQNSVQSAGSSYGNSAAIQAMQGLTEHAEASPDNAAVGVDGAGGGHASAAPPPSGGGDGEAVPIFAQEISKGGNARAVEMLRQAPAAQAGSVAAAMNETLGPETSAQILEEEGESAGVPAPDVTHAEEADAGEGGEERGEEGPEETEAGAGGGGEEGGGGAAPCGADLLATPGAPSASSPEGQAAAATLDTLPTSDLALIHTELVEHQRWSGAQTKVGEAGSPDRAAFVAEKAGEGAISGGLMGAGMGFAAGAIGKLTARFVPIPGVGAILGGAMSVYGLATRDWDKTGETIGKFGQGDSDYDMLANTIASVSEVIDLVCNIMNVIAGVIGIISAVMWIISIVTLGVASPLAATLSAIAMGIGAASGILDLINNLVLQPCVLLFRALHTFSSEADPRDVEAQGAGISDASGRAAGALGGWVGGKAGEAAGSAGGDAILTRIGGAADAPTQTVDAPTQTVDAPTQTSDGPSTSVEPPRPLVIEAPTVDVPRTNTPDPVQAHTEIQPKRGMAAIQERFGQHLQTERAALAQKTADIETARTRAQEQRQAQIESERLGRHQEIDAAHQRRMQEVADSRPQVEATARQTAHEKRMADIKAAGDAHQDALRESGARFQEQNAAATSSAAERKVAIDRQYADRYIMDVEMRAQEARMLAEISDPDLRLTMERRWAAQRSQNKSDWDLEYATQLHDSAVQSAQEVSVAAARQRQDMAQAADAHRQAQESAELNQRRTIAQASERLDAQEQQIRRDSASARGGADAHASSRQGEVDGVGNAAAEQAGPQAQAQHDQTVADSKAGLNETRREQGGRAVLDGMAKAREGYLVQENWRPDYLKRMAGEPGTIRHFVVDQMMWPFLEDLTGPFIIRPRMNLDADGNVAQPHADFQPWAVRGNADAPAPMSRAGNAARGNEKLGGVATGLTSLARAGDSEESTPTPAAQVNPDYQEPPGSPEQLDVIMQQIDDILAGRAQAEAAEQQMSSQLQSHQANNQPIDECVMETTSALSAQQAHEEAVARSQAANTEQQSRQQESEGLVGSYGERAAGLTIIKGPLAAFQGFTWIASKIPGNAGKAMGRMNDDANKMDAAFSQMDGTMEDQSAGQAEKAEQLSTDAERLTQTQTQAAGSGEQLGTAEQGAKGLKQANDTKISEATQAESEAAGQKQELDSAAERKQGEHDSLKGELVSWAGGHRAARLSAQAEAANKEGS